MDNLALESMTVPFAEELSQIIGLDNKVTVLGRGEDLASVTISHN